VFCLAHTECNILCCSPSVNNPAALTDFDKLLRSEISHLINCDLLDEQWLQASLPIKMGGLGVRKVSSLALTAYLASVASTVSLQNTILEAFTTSEDKVSGAYLSKWQSIPSTVLPSYPFQWSSLSAIFSASLRPDSKWKSQNPTLLRRHLAASTPHSVDWLLALPVASCGLKLDDEAVRVAVALCLGLNLGVPHTCRCRATVDALGQHCFVCKQAPSRIARHQHQNDLVTHALVSAGIPVSCILCSLIITRKITINPASNIYIPTVNGRPPHVCIVSEQRFNVPLDTL